MPNLETIWHKHKAIFFRIYFAIFVFLIHPKLYQAAVEPFYQGESNIFIGSIVLSIFVIEFLGVKLQSKYFRNDRYLCSKENELYKYLIGFIGFTRIILALTPLLFIRGDLSVIILFLLLAKDHFVLDALMEMPNNMRKKWESKYLKWEILGELCLWISISILYTLSWEVITHNITPFSGLQGKELWQELFFGLILFLAFFIPIQAQYIAEDFLRNKTLKSWILWALSFLGIIAIGMYPLFT
ncbi:hypothetical protein HOH67_03190 [Candidatus Peregrinibacteria bacterium]|jgi:hypothetical protein|nr:hypothetical protein [Candidatus Peregrinibacteria bacterium]MBT5824106.1 hypothetical protein [Candidatus Peregrinibacteria bacterium]